MPKKFDMIGKKFGKLTVLEECKEKKDRKMVYKCRCSCGNIVNAVGTRLRNGHIRSCGCLRKENTIKSHITHGMSNSNLYRRWSHIKDRCINEQDQAYKDYGKRGITMCDEWLNDFQAFYDWSVKNGYQEDLTIDRIDNDKGYSPSNCRWVDRKTQARNRRTTKYITYKGETKPLAEWCEILNLKYNTIRDRIYRYNWNVEKAFTKN